MINLFSCTWSALLLAFTKQTCYSMRSDKLNERSVISHL